MVLSEQARRNWKIAAIVCTTIAGVNATLFAEYKIPNDKEEPHVFTPIHQWVQSQKKRWLVESHPHNTSSSSSQTNENDDQQQKQISETDSNNLVADIPKPSSDTHNNHKDNVSELRRIAKGHR